MASSLEKEDHRNANLASRFFEDMCCSNTASVLGIIGQIVNYPQAARRLKIIIAFPARGTS